MSENTFTQKLAKIQKELKAPKNQRNNFGNYNYRNKEDILEAAKPLLGDLILTVSDDIVQVGTRIYVKATATITDGINSQVVSGWAREPEEQKGMNAAQVTGSTSSYAGKYALNGLFLIDDTKDADTDVVTALSKGEKMPVQKQVASTLKEGMEMAKANGGTAVVTIKKDAVQDASKPSTNETVEVTMVAANPDNAVSDVPKKAGGWGKSRKTEAAAPAKTGDLY